MLKKYLVAKHSPENLCFADEDEELIVAPPDHPKLKGINKDEWFFVGKKSNKPSRYAWGKIIDDESEVSNKITGEKSDSYSQMINKVKSGIVGYPDGCPVACCWTRKGIIHKSREFQVHRMFF